MKEKLEELKRRLALVSDLQNAEGLLSWDQQTYMPPKGAGARAEQIATLGRLAHEYFVTDEVGALLNELSDYATRLDYDSDEASLIRVTQREYAKARRVPAFLIEDLSRISSLAFESWERAREESDFRIFLPDLQKIVEREIELANYLGYSEHIYDALLDQYEPEMKTSQLEAIFAPLKQEVTTLAQSLMNRIDGVDDSVLYREYDEQKQWDFGIAIIRQIGFDFESGRQDKSVHPFTSGFALNDVRITTRVDKHFLPMMLFGTIHETGHALYDMGYRPELDRTPLSGGASLGVHESQSRLWENMVGRSRAFWRHWFPLLRETFPAQLGDQSVESFYRAINKVKPSFIRVEADEVTYSLHIMLRFEIEKMLLERSLKAADVPEAWNAKMKDYFGIVPPNDGEGCLQDIHWSSASIGYFPTYALGSMFAVQLWEQAARDLPTLSQQIENGQYAGLLGWLRTHLHTHGHKFTLDELARRITGESLQSRSYTTYLKRKFGEIYGL